MSNDLFLEAARQKIRFESPKGLLTVEDLWDLPLTSETGKVNLDTLAVELYGDLTSASAVPSFVRPASNTTNKLVELKFGLVRHIIDVRVAERDAEAQRRVNAERKQKLLAILDRKEDAALEAMPVEELRTLVAGM